MFHPWIKPIFISFIFQLFNFSNLEVDEVFNCFFSFYIFLNLNLKNLGKRSGIRLFQFTSYFSLLKTIYLRIIENSSFSGIGFKTQYSFTFGKFEFRIVASCWHHSVHLVSSRFQYLRQPTKIIYCTIDTYHYTCVSIICKQWHI